MDSSAWEVSAREADVLAALAGDRTNAQVARQLGIGVRTVESHVSALLRKLAVPDRRALARLAGTTRRFAGLPTPATSFVGRAAEHAAVLAALGDHRLVSLLGPGGVGKTRLAIAVAGDHPAGGAFVDLVPVRAGFVLAATAAALGVAERPPQPLADTLLDRLHAGPTLLVLDNCEHLVDEVGALVARILAGTPDTTILATSRERLGVMGERPVLVEPLPLSSDAERLFLDRAGSPAAPADVTELCAGLDGMPLAIELAAARAASLGLAGLRAGLADRLRLLTGSRGADRRHSSLRAVIGWSYDLLDDTERAMFRRLAVFAGGFDLTAAATIGELPAAGAADLLGRLTDKSLLRRDGDRWSLLATVRAFAMDALTESGELARTRARHLEWAADVATELVAHLDGEWRDAFDAVAADLRAALPGSHRLAGGLARLTFASGRFVEAREYYEIAAGLAPGSPDQDLRDAADAALAVADGGAAYRLLCRTASHEYAVVVHNRYDLVEPASVTATGPLATAWANRTDLALARHAVDTARTVTDRLCALDVLGIATMSAGRLREAHRIAQDRLRLAMTLPRHEPAAVAELVDAFHVASTTAIAVGDLPAALELARRAPVDDPVADHPYVSAPRQVRVLTLTGELTAACDWATTMWAGWQAAGCPPADWMSSAVAMAALAHGLLDDGEFAVWRARAVEIARAPDAPSLAASAAFVDARTAVHTGDLSAAPALVERAFGSFQERWWEPYAHAAGAELAVVAGLPDAESYVSRATAAASENDWAAAALTRARARLTGDRAVMASAVEQFSRIQAHVERAVTLESWDR